MARLTIRDSVIATIVYADIFDYPLTAQELRMWLNVRSPQRSRLLRLKGEILRCVRIANVDYYGFRRVRQLVAIKRERVAWSKTKMLLAKRMARWFRLIPTITLAGVTGGLAMQNAKKEDDVDLFFITKSGTLWITRLLATILAELLGVRRRPNDTRFSNKLCLNMFMAEDSLGLPKHERDLFAAHEVLQMIPLWEQEGTYGKLLSANRWVRNFLPNMWSLLSLRVERSNLMLGIAPSYSPRSDRIQRFFVTIVIWILRFLELPVRNLQLWYMKNRRTNEIVSDSVIRFHPRDARVWVKKALAQRLGRLNIPLDKVFYGS